MFEKQLTKIKFKNYSMSDDGEFISRLFDFEHYLHYIFCENCRHANNNTQIQLFQIIYLEDLDRFSN